MELRSKLNNDFTNRDRLHHAILKVYKARHSLRNFSFRMFKMAFSRCLNTLWHPPEQPLELTQKKTQQKENHHIHYILILSLLLVIIMA